MYESYLDMLAELRAFSHDNKYIMCALLGVSKTTLKKILNANKDDCRVRYGHLKKTVSLLKGKRSLA